MPDALNLSLDPHLEQQLSSQLDHEIQLGNFELTHGRVFVVDAGSGDPGKASLFSSLKEKLDPYVDFDNRGLKVVQFKYHGADARFTVVPSWHPAEVRSKGFGGPSIGLKFSMSW